MNVSHDGSPSHIAPTLVRRWGLPSDAADRVITVGSAVSMCRWYHTTREIADGTIPANTLVLMRNNGESIRHRGRSSESAAARRGHLGLLPASSYGRWTFPGADVVPVEVLHLYFPADYLERLVAQAGTGGQVELCDHLDLRDRRLQMLAREIDAALDDDDMSRLYIEGLATAIASRLLSAYSSVSPPLCRERGGLAPWQLKRSCDAMTARLDGDIGLDELAEIAGCSPTHFSRAFKKSMGLPPFYWLNERRIDRAKELLANPTLSLAAIALELGFSAQPQFTTAFGRATGTTPGQWRRERLR